MFRGAPSNATAAATSAAHNYAGYALHRSTGHSLQTQPFPPMTMQDFYRGAPVKVSSLTDCEERQEERSWSSALRSSQPRPPVRPPSPIGGATSPRHQTATLLPPGVGLSQPMNDAATFNVNSMLRSLLDE